MPNLLGAAEVSIKAEKDAAYDSTFAGAKKTAQDYGQAAQDAADKGGAAFNEASKKIVSSLREKAKALAMGKEELKLYKLAQIGASEADLEAAKRAAKDIQALKERAAQQKANAKAAQEQQAAVKNIVKALEDENRALKLTAEENLRYKLSSLGATEADIARALAIRQNTASLNSMNAISGALGGTLSTLGGVVASLAVAYAGWKMVDLIKDSSLLAARVQTLDAVLTGMGKATGISQTAIELTTKSLEKQGITYQEARNSVAKMIVAHIDLAQAQQIATIAQGAAVVQNMNSSEAMGHLIHGLESGNVHVLRTIGLNVNFEQSYEKLAAKLGKNKDALNQNELMQARVNAVVEKAPALMTAYADAMETPGKKITSMARLIENFQADLGKPFVPGLTKIIDEMTAALKDLSAIIKDPLIIEGLKDIGSTAAWAFTQIKEAGLGAVQWATDMLKAAEIHKKFMEYQKAGVNIDIGKIIAAEHDGLVTSIALLKEYEAEYNKIVGIHKIGARPQWWQDIGKGGPTVAGADNSNEEMEKQKKAKAEALREEKRYQSAMVAMQKETANKTLSIENEMRQAISEADKKYTENDFDSRVKALDALRDKWALYSDDTTLIDKAIAAKTAEIRRQQAEQEKKDRAAINSQMIKADQDFLASEFDLEKGFQGNKADLRREFEKIAADMANADYQMAVANLDLEKAKYEKTIQDKDIINRWYYGQLDILEQKRIQSATVNASKYQDELTKRIKAFDPGKSDIFGNFASVFNDDMSKAAAGVSPLITAFDHVAKKQKELIELQKELAQNPDIKNRSELITKLAKDEQTLSNERIAAYGQLFGVASQFFDKESGAREALHKMQMAFAAAELAMNAQKTAQALAGIASEVAAKTTAFFVSAADAIATQGEGDAYSAWGRIAGMIALMGSVAAMAGIAFAGATSGGGAGKSVGGMQQGAVFGGAADEQSNSIKHSADLLEKMHKEDQTVLWKIYDAVSKTANSIGGLTASIINRDLATGGNWVMSSTGESPAWSEARRTGADFARLAYGYDVSAIVGDVMRAGGQAMVSEFNQYRFSKRGMFGGTSVWTDTFSQMAGGDVTEKFTGLFQGISKLLYGLAEGYGPGKTAAIDQYQFGGRIVTSGLTGAQLQERLQQFASGQADAAVMALFGDLVTRYRKIGEAAAETAIRVLSEKEAVMADLEKTNISFKDAWGSAIDFSQSLIEIAGGLDKLDAAASNYYDKFFTDEEKAANIKTQMGNLFSGLGLGDLPASREAFRQVVEGLDLSTESGKQAYVSLMNASDMADQYYSTIEDDAKTALAHATEVANKKFDLENQILQLTGREAEATRLQREKELAAMDESLRPLQERVWALQDEKAAADAAKTAAQEKLTEAQGILRKAIDNQIAEYQRLADKANENLEKARGLLQRSFDAEKESITKAHESIITGLTGSLDAAKGALSDLQGVVDSLRSARKSMFAAGTEKSRYFDAQSNLFSAVSAAQMGDYSKATGVVDSMSVLQGDTQKYFSTAEDYKRNFFKTYNSIAQLESLTGKGVDEQQRVVDKIQKQIDDENEHFNTQIVVLQNQLDAILGVDKSTVSVEEAIRRFQNAQSAADGANTLLRTQTDALNRLYDSLTGNNGPLWSIARAVDNVRAAIREAKGAGVDVPGFAAGGDTPGGLYVAGETGAELIASGPARIWSHGQTKSMLDQSEVVEAIRELYDLIRQGNFVIARNTLKTSKILDKFDIVGMPGERAA